MESACKSLGAYIHIPFCKTICSYCDFCKFLYNKKWINDYLNALESEIIDRYMGEEISSLYIGGGTPSALDETEIEKLLTICKKLKLTERCEFTFECNLNDITAGKIKLLKKNHVNRISIGIESFNKDNLKIMNRESIYADAVQKIALIRKMGIDNINVDLIYALPGESIKTLKNDLKLITKLNPSHISTYSLMIEDNTVLKNKGTEPISEELDAKMYKFICRYLKRKKYSHYEVSNFARQNHEAKHNLVYWNNEQYYGFGVAASGYIDAIRYDNTKSLTQYLKGIYVKNEEILSKDDVITYEVMLGLRKTNGINLKTFHEKYGINLQSKFDISVLLENRDLIVKNGNIFINPDKLYIMNEILLKIV